MGNLLRNQKVRDALLQAIFVGAIAAMVLAAVLIARNNLIAQNMTSGFGFLRKSTGWDLNFSLLPASATDPYWWYFVIGIVNTLFLGVIGLMLATIVGAVVGLARTSSNELARLLGRTYVDIFRNIPLILQVFFWYAMMTHLPAPRNAHQGFGFMLSSRGFYVPLLNVAGWAEIASAFALVAAIVLPVWIGRSERIARPLTERATLQWSSFVLGLLVSAAILLAGRIPDAPLLDLPALQGLNIRGGLRIPSEFTALAIAIAIYGGSYIAEIVRGGFKAVGRGQEEAARSLGLTPWQAFTHIRFPLALRAMLPILANQYVWLMKATTMGIAIGFTDFFMIVALTINHSGQTIEVIGILMAGFLMINLSLAAIFNRINKAIALKGNQLRS